MEPECEKHDVALLLVNVISQLTELPQQMKREMTPPAEF